MTQNINVEGLTPEQIKEIQTMVEALKAENKTDRNETEIDMVDYLLENTIRVDDLELMKRGDIYERNK
ncbi:MAG: hypothetical protein AB4062_13190 [Crocosphaera sp.]